jgi:hypothetical protein
MFSGVLSCHLLGSGTPPECAVVVIGSHRYNRYRVGKLLVVEL